MTAILVAGATGNLGRYVCQEVLGRGHTLSVLARSPDRVGTLTATPHRIHIADARNPDELDPAFEEVEVAFSCLGASVMPARQRPDRSFAAVDLACNINLIDAARRHGVKRFVYVSIFGAEKYPDLAYVKAHEQVVDHLKDAGIDWAVIRPVAFFSAFAMYYELASRGRGAPVIGSGEVKSNPIHEADLAVLCADAIDGEGGEHPAGGPTTYTRKQIAELAYEVAGRHPKVRLVPAWVVRAAGYMARPVWPRLSALAHFYATIAGMDLVAAPMGKRELPDYFRTLAEQHETIKEVSGDHVTL